MKNEKLSSALAALMPSASRQADKVFSDHYEEIKAALERNVAPKELLKILELGGAKMSLAKFKRLLASREPKSEAPSGPSEPAA